MQTEKGTSRNADRLAQDRVGEERLCNASRN